MPNGDASGRDRLKVADRPSPFRAVLSFVAVAPIILTSPAVAQGGLEAPWAQIAGDEFIETYDPQAPVSGAPLAGLRLGSVEGKFDPSEARLALPFHAGGRLCVRAVTRDGRYHSDNPYALPEPSLVGAIRLSPVTQSFGEQLGSYDWHDFAVVGRLPGLSADGGCEGASGIYVPQLGTVPNGRLQLAVNSRGRSVTAVLRDGAIEVSAVCGSPASGANIAFDKVCDIDASPFQSREAELRLSLDDGFGVEVFDYAVFVPGGP